MAHDPQPPHHLSNMVEAVIWTCMAANGPGSLVFIDDATAGRSRMNSDVYRALLSDSGKYCKTDGTERHCIDG